MQGLGLRLRDFRVWGQGLGLEAESSETGRLGLDGLSRRFGDDH